MGNKLSLSTNNPGTLIQTFSFFSQPVAEASEETVQWAAEWSSICSCVLGRELSIWDEFLRPLLLERAKVKLTVQVV